MTGLWSWLKQFAERKEREQWMQKHHHDRKCPHCDTWQGNCGGFKAASRDDPDPMHDKYQCGRCGQWSTWFEGGMVPVLAQDQRLTTEGKAAPEQPAKEQDHE